MDIKNDIIVLLNAIDDTWMLEQIKIFIVNIQK